MTKVVTPSPKFITDGQIGKFQELLGARLRKSGLESGPVQRVLQSQGDAVVEDMLAAIRKRVEGVSNLIVRRVAVDRTRTPQEVLDATGRKQYVDRKMVDSMPRGKGEETDVYFFKPRPEAYSSGGLISDDRLEAEFEFHGLKPDPYAQAAVNEADPVFADGHPNGTHWKNADGKWYYVAFYRWYGGRGVDVGQGGDGWGGGWWFAGVVRK